MSTKKPILIGCGSVLLVALLLVAVIIAVVVYGTQDIQGASLSVKSPLEVTVGDTFDLVVNVKNERETKALLLSTIDISPYYLAGFTVVSTEPTPKSSMDVPLAGLTSFTFSVSIPAGETRSFTFTLRAQTPGIYRGDIDMWEGARILYTVAQTVVKEKE